MLSDVGTKKFSIGFLGAGGRLMIENGLLRYTSPYAKQFQVAVKDINTVSIDAKGAGKGLLKIVGYGAVLAEVEMPTKWATKCQMWILSAIDH
jgi:hypothetical protein